MQTYPLTFSYGAAALTTLAVNADLFVYESATIATRTNYLTGSNDLVTGWNMTAGPTVTVDPNGNTYNGSPFKVFAKTTTSGSEYYGQDTLLAGVVGAYWTFSVALRAAVSGSVAVGIWDGTGWGLASDMTAEIISGPGTFVVANNAPPALTGLSSTTTTFVRVTRKLSTTGTVRALFYPGGVGNTVVGQSIMAAAAQLEQGNVPTPYIQTGAASVTASTGDTRIKVKAANGNEIVLKPGQRVRMTDKASSWNVRSYDGITPIAANIIIGSGEFDDSVQTFKVDGTSGTVPVAVQSMPGTAVATQVTNTVANRVPVTLDVTQTLNTSTAVMAYTTSYSSTASTVTGTAVQLLAAATNVNGVILNKFEWMASPAAGNVTWTVLAKATAPTSINDGDVLLAGQITSGAFSRSSLDIGKDGQPKVPAGKGIWLWPTAVDGNVLRDALFTVL